LRGLLNLLPWNSTMACIEQALGFHPKRDHS